MKIENLGMIENLVSDESRFTTAKYVWFDAERGRLVATNGHALMVVACEADKDDVSGPITAEALATWRQFKKANSIRNMVMFRALENELVIEDLVEGKKVSYRRPPERQFPQWEMLIPDVKGRPPEFTFDPMLLKQVVDAMPKDEMGKGVRSISIWVDPVHKLTAAELKAGEVQRVPPLIVKASHEGALCVMMPVTGMDKEHWNTKIPGIPRKAIKALPAPAAPEPTQTTTEVPGEAPAQANEPLAPSPEASKRDKPGKNKKAAISPVPIPVNGHDSSQTHVA